MHPAPKRITLQNTSRFRTDQAPSCLHAKNSAVYNGLDWLMVRTVIRRAGMKTGDQGRRAEFQADPIHSIQDHGQDEQQEEIDESGTGREWVDRS
jgi:hypothetical protein